MAQIVDQRELLNSYRPGDVQASERIVRLYQNELLRSTYLLTASADGAVLLARDAFLDFFRRLMRGDVPDDPRYGLLQSLGRSYLIDPETVEPDNGDGPSSALSGMISVAEERQHYQVGDERSRALEALELLDRETRLGLVLRDFNALDEEPVCQILDETPFTLRERLQPARDRLLDSASASAGGGVRELLITAATAAPRPNLWPEVAGPLDDVFAKEDERRQRYTYAAAGVVALLLFIAGLWLFDVFPFGGDGGQAAIAPTAGPTATPTATPEPTVTPTAVPELSSFAIPLGDVPGRIMMGIGGIQGSQRIAEAGYFDLESGQFVPHQELNQFGTPSPDGRYLLGMVTPEFSLNQTRRALVVLDSASGEQLWRVDLAASVVPSFAVTLDRVYLAPRTATGESETPTLRVYDLQSGELLDERSDIITNLQSENNGAGRIGLKASPDYERLFIVMEETGDGLDSMAFQTLASYTLPELTLESANTQTESPGDNALPSDEFDYSSAQVTPDGLYLYNIDQDTVQFRSSGIEEDLDREIHFSVEPNPSQNSDLRWISSNDGRYLFVIALERNEAAIVDLLARRVIRIFPLDIAGGAEPLQQFQSAALGASFGAGLTLSPDGRFLYVGGGIAADATSGSVEQSVIWKVDLTTWTVTHSWEVAGLIVTTSYLNDQLIVSTQSPQATGPPAIQAVVIDPESGAVVETFDQGQLPEWVDSFYAYSLSKIYHLIHARAPAVDHQAPADVELESTLPRLTALSSSETVPVGSPVELAVRVLNPVDGQRVTDALPDVRFDTGSTVVIRLLHEDGAAEEIILIASRTEPGEYRASSTLPETGTWNAEISITSQDGASWTQTAESVVQGVPSWEAADGKRYMLEIDFDPDEPEVDEQAEVTARFIEIRSGELLPDDVDLIETFPDELRVEFRSPQDRLTSAMLTRNDEGIYEGVHTFEAGGVWETRIYVSIEVGDPIEFGAGSVEVVE